MSEDVPQEPDAGSLILKKAGPLGVTLGLIAGDQLVAINGLPFSGTLEGLRTRIGTQGADAALTFKRNDKSRIVLAQTFELGVWEMGPKLEPSVLKPKRIHPAGMQNWEVFRSADGLYDLQSLTPPSLALLPPIWLAQARLWTQLGIWGAITLASIPAGIWISLILQVLMSLYFWRAAPTLFRADRLARGMRGLAILAAPNEAKIHEAMADLDPKLRYIYAANTETASEEAEPESA